MYIWLIYHSYISSSTGGSSASIFLGRVIFISLTIILCLFYGRYCIVVSSSMLSIYEWSGFSLSWTPSLGRYELYCLLKGGLLSFSETFVLILFLQFYSKFLESFNIIESYSDPTSLNSFGGKKYLFLTLLMFPFTNEGTILLSIKNCFIG